LTLDPARIDVYGQDEKFLMLTAIQRVKSDEKADERADERADIVQVLIQHGADVTAQNNTRSTPLHLASSKRSGNTVKLLLRHGADVNAQDGRNSTPLQLAASSRLALKGNVVHLLLSHGANVDAKDDRGLTPFQIASSRRGCVVERTPFQVASSRGPRLTARRLGNSVSDCVVERTLERTPFQIASSRGLSDITELLSDYQVRGE